ncbi:M81 family metallopeptidase [Bordetella hinzii]|uniref:M81 family metallopeptidase n=1 Tax=Bordetella hinzii TaxID=103855 RepID=UPI00045B8193|nr:M81 family metallopeptidase [Bordetella hinzii]KCB44743.1 PF07364 family protein [Bordetella hinzii 4161]KXA73350.1 MlrC family protein 10 [Bordetella hinzii LMG 13501]QDJ39420.1 MlrC family protein 10 [Bordetella hinzii]QDJ57404.1 MlrC family protein 10 [Bordetella hinzii]VEH23413.1 peptidase [Bordetella hinzii]
MSTKRLAVARFWFEGNAFGPVPATQARFDEYEWQAGVQALEAMRGTATELGAVAHFADEHPDWEVVVLRCAAALPAGPIAEDVLQRFLGEVEAGLARGRWDAVYLSLHGAAITAGRETPELDIARRVREWLPDVPLGASFDLHGNLPPAWAEVLDVASVYRTHPHVDMAETAARVLDGLVRCATEGLRTARVLLNEGVILPSINMRTAPGGPMHTLEQAAREATVAPVLEVAVFGGFPYADTAATGAAVFAISDARADPDGAAARRAARAVMDRIHALAADFRVSLPDPAQALAHALASPLPGLIAVTDSGDNPLSGGAGDTPGLFAALVAARPRVPTLFASFADPRAVAAARQAGVGQTVALTLGGRNGPRFGAGVPVRAVVRRLTDGEFVNSGPMHHGVARSCGASALLQLADLPEVSVIVTERVVAGDDPAFYALHGVDTARLRLLCVKAKNHFRAAFAQRCAEIIDCDAPGPACLDLSRLPFRHRHIPAGY